MSEENSSADSMADTSADRTADNAARLEAIQTVVDRVSSWQDGATEGTVASELRKGFGEVGVDVGDDEVARLADAIQDAHGEVSAAEVLG